MDEFILLVSDIIEAGIVILVVEIVREWRVVYNGVSDVIIAKLVTS